MQVETSISPTVSRQKYTGMTIERQNWPERYFPLEEYHARWEKLSAEMEASGYDIAVVWGRTAGNFERAMEILWLTNFNSTHSGLEPDSPGSKIWQAFGYSCAIVRRGQEPILVGDEPEPLKHILAVDNYTWSRNTIETAAKVLLEQQREGRVAFVGSDCLPVKYADQFRALTPGIEYVFDDDLIRKCRLIKSPRELDCYREGGDIATSALNRLMDGLCSGKSAAEASADAAHEIVRRGGIHHRIPTNWGETMLTATERSPMYGICQEAPERGDLVWGMIYGPLHQGYWHDPGRTAVVGRKPTAAQRALLEDSYSVIEAMLDMTRPGTKVADIALEAERVKATLSKDDDYKDMGWPHQGHGNGMSWEPPFLNAELCTDEDVLKPGMVLGYETFLTRKGVGAADWEENLIVTEDGYELICKSPVFWF